MRFPLDVFIVDLRCYFLGSVGVLAKTGPEGPTALYTLLLLSLGAQFQRQRQRRLLIGPKNEVMFLRRGRQRARRPTWDRAATLVTTHYTTVLPEWNGGMFCAFFESANRPRELTLHPAEIPDSTNDGGGPTVRNCMGRWDDESGTVGVADDFEAMEVKGGVAAGGGTDTVPHLGLVDGEVGG